MASLVAQMVKNLPTMQETWVQSMGQEDPLEKGMVLTLVFLPGETERERERENVFPFLNLCFLFVWFLFFAMLHGKWDLIPSTRDLTRAPCIGRYLILCRNGNNRNLGVILNSKGKSFNIFTTN